ncbi:NADH-quinone oxidoreductase subunit N [Actinopolymorpha cephalotaxi]|uniref:NADH-quinone oxidoreductase subunit N n=1 Tax=Actinopolymorpha cephalotaxi TaxID=504797 RepID=A0A1I2NQH3_9ACTN|nr:NADH-quinone oxidoreductase subunit N [Actinopolymorpha cephalotaxi]NYH85432.1 NADH-quinone oxidoreductase subunit N [Actinopolymorpha cephalotaxi]SFG05270.1 NADH-quinone oxidoreductase subunit N [Actinopolymorpha cephalotaxi]
MGSVGAVDSMGSVGSVVSAVVGFVQPVPWLVISPPLAVAVTALLVLVVDSFAIPRRRGIAPRLALAGLLVGLFLVMATPVWSTSWMDGAFCAGGAVEPWLTSACSYVGDPFTWSFQFLIAGAGVIVVLLSTGKGRARDPEATGPGTGTLGTGTPGTGTLGGGIPTGEYHFLLLASAAGAMTLAAARDLITLVVALEVVSLPVFALVGLRRGDRRGAEGALKFFLVSVVSVAVMLFGVSLVYGVTGTMYLDRIAAALHAPGPASPVGYGGPLAPMPALPGGDLAAVAGLGVMLTLVGLAFKVASVPFHFWVPDTYVGAPVPVAAYLSVVSKAAGFAGILLVLGWAFPGYVRLWAPVVGVLAAATMTLGNLVALRQRNAVRLLAWSSVAQAGYLLVPLAASNGYVKGTTLTTTMAYLLIYVVANLGAFAVVSLTVSSGPGRLLGDYRGLFWRRPGRALALGFFLLALAGLPPGVFGLFGKFVLFRAAIDGGAGWLAVVMAVNVVIALAYYLPWTALLFRSPEGAAESGAEAAGETGGAVAGPAGAVAAVWAGPWPARITVCILVVIAVLLSVFPDLALDSVSYPARV